jgi:hypothetical protein
MFSLEYIKRITSPDFLLRSQIDSEMMQIDRLGLRYEYEERAAIFEYDGGLSRENAERRALAEILGRCK